MTIDSWILLALMAMALNVAKVVSVKTSCKTIDPSALVFHSRLFAALLLIVPAWFSNYIIHDSQTFWSATLLAALITIFASVLYVKSIQLGDLVIVSPIQASIPVFMIMTTYLLFDEAPSYSDLLCILLIVISVGYVMLRQSRNGENSRRQHTFYPALLSITAALLYGISTVVDRVAIGATSNGAILYSAVWNVMTVILLSGYLWRHHQRVQLEFRQHCLAIVVYVIVSMLAFVLQQMAVAQSIDIDNGVTYVKAIVMIHISIAALIGVSLLREKVTMDILFANIVALLSGLAMVLVD